MAKKGEAWPVSLVQPDRVHRDVYRDPAIFDLEMERIFRRAWLYVGHESQVPNPGDYVAATLAGQPVLIVRHTQDTEVRVIFNRCGHRAAQVTTHARGNVKLFRCCYHGWTFKTDGTVHGIPLRRGYSDCYDLNSGQFDMKPVPRLGSYRGFLFASLASDGPDLLSYLGPMTKRLDEVVDRAPKGKITVGGGVHKYRFAGNWKLQIENLNDMYHPHASHESTIDARGQQFKRGERTSGGAELATDNSGNPLSSWDDAGVWTCSNGHSWCGAMPGTVGRGSGPVFDRYEKLLQAGHGSKRTEEVLNLKWHNSIVYPNLVFQAMAQHIRVIHPVSVDETEIHIHPILLDGVPEEMNREIIRYLNVTHSPASLIQTDDLESFRRIQAGVGTSGHDWVVFGRGYGDEGEADDGAERMFGTSEIPIRNQYCTWVDYMNAGHTA